MSKQEKEALKINVSTSPLNQSSNSSIIGLEDEEVTSPFKSNNKKANRDISSKFKDA
jgi:hypothetical protein